MAKDYTRAEVLAIVKKTAEQYGIPLDDFMRASYIETGGRFDEKAYNASGAAGLYQFMPDTAAQYGIRGREYDPVVSADAAARLYLDNQKDIVGSHNRSGRPYLSGESQPNGLDMYLAHQQGAYGYRSMQAAIDTGSFFNDTPHMRRNILANVADSDLKSITGVTRAQLSAMSDRDMAKTFVDYWETKYNRIAIPEVGIAPKTVGGPSQGGVVPSPNAMADGVLKEGENGPEVKRLQEQLIALGFKGRDGKPLSPDSDFGGNTKFAVESYQRSRGLDVDGVAGKDTFDALKANKPAINTPQAPGAPGGASGSTGTWPAPGNFKINDADKAGEGHGEFGTPRSNRSGKHSGLDIEGKVGDPIVPYAAGKVVFADVATGYGKTVVIDHGNRQRTLYAHLDKINVTPGQDVTPQTKIATMGRSGNTPSTGDTHLHFEIRFGARAGEPFSGKAVDPLPYLKGAKQIQPGNTNPLADGVLVQGEKGEVVKQLQEQLNRLGFKDAQGRALVPDKDFGASTRQAVEAFQRSKGLEVDGKVGKDTFAALKAAEAQKTAPTPPAAGVNQGNASTALLNSLNGADKKLFSDVMQAMGKLPTGTFENEEAKLKAAAAITVEAKRSGMSSVDLVQPSTKGAGLIASSGDPKSGVYEREFVSAPTLKQPVEESVRQLQDNPAKVAAEPAKEPKVISI